MPSSSKERQAKGHPSTSCARPSSSTEHVELSRVKDSLSAGTLGSVSATAQHTQPFSHSRGEPHGSSPTDPFPQQHHMRFPAVGSTTHALASTAG